MLWHLNCLYALMLILLSAKAFTLKKPQKRAIDLNDIEDFVDVVELYPNDVIDDSFNLNNRDFLFPSNDQAKKQKLVLFNNNQVESSDRYDNLINFKMHQMRRPVSSKKRRYVKPPRDLKRRFVNLSPLLQSDSRNYLGNLADATNDAILKMQNYAATLMVIITTPKPTSEKFRYLSKQSLEEMSKMSNLTKTIMPSLAPKATVSSIIKRKEPSTTKRMFSKQASISYTRAAKKVNNIINNKGLTDSKIGKKSGKNNADEDPLLLADSFGAPKQLKRTVKNQRLAEFDRFSLQINPNNLNSDLNLFKLPEKLNTDSNFNDKLETEYKLTTESNFFNDNGNIDANLINLLYKPNGKDETATSEDITYNDPTMEFLAERSSKATKFTNPITESSGKSSSLRPRLKITHALRGEGNFAPNNMEELLKVVPLSEIKENKPLEVEKSSKTFPTTITQMATATSMSTGSKATPVVSTSPSPSPSSTPGSTTPKPSPSTASTPSLYTEVKENPYLWENSLLKEVNIKIRNDFGAGSINCTNKQCDKVIQDPIGIYNDTADDCEMYPKDSDGNTGGFDIPSNDEEEYRRLKTTTCKRPTTTCTTKSSFGQKNTCESDYDEEGETQCDDMHRKMKNTTKSCALEKKKTRKPKLRPFRSRRQVPTESTISDTQNPALIHKLERLRRDLLVVKELEGILTQIKHESLNDRAKREDLDKNVDKTKIPAVDDTTYPLIDETGTDPMRGKKKKKKKTIWKKLFGKREHRENRFLNQDRPNSQSVEWHH